MNYLFIYLNRNFIFDYMNHIYTYFNKCIYYQNDNRFIDKHMEINDNKFNDIDEFNKNNKEEEWGQFIYLDEEQ